MADAIKGDAKARDWLSRYLMPNPNLVVAVVPDADAEAAALRRAALAELRQLMDRRAERDNANGKVIDV